MSGGHSESSLIQQAVAGDRACLSQLLLLHYDGLDRYVAARISPELRGLVRPEDILHQTFVRAARSIGSFEWRHERPFRAWLKAIAGNLVKDAQKRRRRERRAGPPPDDRRAAGSTSSVRAMVERIAGESTSPSGRAQRRENFRCLQTAIASLPAEQQEVIRRHYLEDQSLEEIAGSMNRTKDAIRGICYRARKNLRAIMGRSSLYFSG